MKDCKPKGEESTCLTYTGLLGELEHLKIETRSINEKFASVMGMSHIHTTAPEQLTDQELLLSTIVSATDLARKHSDGWDKEHPKCLF
jgi:hypothetical protein